MATKRLNGVPISEITIQGKLWSKKKQKLFLPKRRRVLIQVAKRDGMTCKYCQRPVHFSWMGDFALSETATFEHITLKSEGGPYTATNGYVACHPCNQNRDNQPIDEFLDKMAQGYYVEDEVKYRQMINKARRTAKHRRCYKVWRKHERRRKLAKVLKDVYATFVWNHVGAELG